MTEVFRCDEQGFVRHWLVSGPSRRPYAGVPDEEAVLKVRALDPRVGPPPAGAAHGREGPAGRPWRYQQPQQNVFVEVSRFYRHQTLLDLYAQTVVDSPRAIELPAVLWAAGTADLWVNRRHVTRLVVGRSPAVSNEQVTLPLVAGANRVDVRVQCFGARDTRHLLGLQVLRDAADLRVRLPGDDDGLTATIAEAERWLSQLALAGKTALSAVAPPPGRAEVEAEGDRLDWPQGATRVDLPDETVRLTVRLDAGCDRLERVLEIPPNRRAVLPPQETLAAHREALIEETAGLDVGDRPPIKANAAAMPALLRAATGRWRGAPDEAIIRQACDYVESRADCADFTLATLLRMLRVGQLPAALEERIRDTALGFRYWSDEEGGDAMWFWSENHRLLFHGCQVIAGAMLPDARFAASGRSGAEQARIGLARCREWLDVVEQRGFNEYHSSSYMPITAAALANLVDFAPEEDVSRRAAGVLDEMYRLLALHAFDGVVIAPQGRVYRDVLYPGASRRQAMISWATVSAVRAVSQWVAFLATSRYEPPSGLEERMAAPASCRYRQDHVEIVLAKTPDYCLSSLAIPSTRDDLGPEALLPGRAGYQQQVWIASLARDCHVFVNHPGATFDMSVARPGYWYGNGSLPEVRQDGAALLCRWEIGPEHPAAFTHAHWPAGAFDEQARGDRWVCGRRGDGLVGLWCSRELTGHDDVLVGRELRAHERTATWVCLCGSAAEESFEAFVKRTHAAESHVPAPSTPSPGGPG